jgi:hypothetical protein
MKRKIKIILFIVGTIALGSCEKLDVPNYNAPSQSEINTSAAGVENLIVSAYKNFWLNTQYNPNINITASVMADQFTASWANFGWQAASMEPRQAWDNTVNGDANDDEVLVNYYYGSYGIISTVNLAVNKIKENKTLLNGGKDNAAYLALSYLIQGMSYGNLGLVFDKAFVVTDSTVDINGLKPNTYDEIRDTAIWYLKNVINICDTAKKFTLSGNIFNSRSMSNADMKALAYSFIVRYMVLTSRNASENNRVNWLTVLNYSLATWPYDFGANYDYQNSWLDFNLYYLTLLSWARVNNRILNLMDPAYPKIYPASGQAPQVHAALSPGMAQSQDARLLSDFEYLSSVNFLPERGLYHYSNYRFKRFDNMLFNNGGGFIYEYRAYESDLYIDEAYTMIGLAKYAISDLNASNNPRTARGKLANLPADASKKTVLNAIFYERDIELMGQGFMVSFCDMRRRDMLQYGTPLHFPIPGKELTTLNMPYYTFGGTANADGLNTSNGGWRTSFGN